MKRNYDSSTTSETGEGPAGKRAIKPMIYIACLAAYTAGRHHGRWISVAQSHEALYAEVQSILKTSPEPFAEEWAIHDHEGFGKIQIEEYHSLSEVSRLARLIEEHGEAFTAYASYVNAEYATEESFLDAYRGHWDSEVAFAMDLFDKLYAHEVPEHLRSYIDFGGFAQDLLLDGHFSVRSSEFGVYVFAGG
jgi:antirestriction protein